jgi:hypothetical protein
MSEVIIWPWDSRTYGGDRSPTQGCPVTLQDKRQTDGQVFIDMAVSSQVDDVLSAIIEVASHPETEEPVPVVRIYRGDDCIANFYADGMEKTLAVLSLSQIQEGSLRTKKEDL